MRDAIYLISKGFNEDTAFALDHKKRTAFCIILKEQEMGAKYNFYSNKFEFPK